MRQGYIDFPESVFLACEMLPDSQEGAVIRALLEHARFGKEPEDLKQPMQQAIYLAAKDAVIHYPKKSKSHKSKRKQLSDKHRFMILERDGYTCQYCGRKAPEVALEVDHIIPVAKGGSNKPSNLITACRECNSGKRAHIIGEERNW